MTHACIPGTGPGTGFGCIEGSGPGTTTIGPPPVVGGAPGIPVAPITIPGAACNLIPPGILRDICLGIARPDANGADPCATGFNRVNGVCVPVVTGGDPTPGGDTPGERGPGAASGLSTPSNVCVNTLVCPTFADGKKGILWMNALTGEVVCLPRATNGKGFGLIRKNKPRAKPPMSAADFRQLKRNKRLAEKAKKLAMDSGFTCKKR